MNRKKWIVRACLGFVKLTGLLPALLFLKPRVILQKGAKRRLPNPGILVSNHKSLMDFVLYLLIFPFQTIRFLMAEVLFQKGKVFASFLYAIGGIKVDRDGKDFGFVSDSIEVLDGGGILGIFPEGRLPIGGKPWPFTASTAYIATHADAPIIPIYTDGNYGFFRRANVVIGAPFDIKELCRTDEPEQEQLQRLTDLLQKKVYDLKAELEHKDEANDTNKNT